jgi:prepilin-type N-terminal cleavage/methylation domain-containing protein
MDVHTKNNFSPYFDADKAFRPRIMGAMRGKRKGFTLVEAVVTIAVLGVTFSLTTVVVTQLVQVQNSAADQTAIESRYQAADSLMNEYVSFVGLNTPGEQGISFAYNYESSSPNSLVFTATYVSSRYDFVLSHDSASKVLSVTCAQTPPEGYLSKSNWTKTNRIEGVTFAYDESLSLITAEICLDASHQRKFAYVVRGTA